MAKVVVLGSGFAGQTAALNLRRSLSKQHEVVVVTPAKKFGYIPSWVWVGVGTMDPEKTQFELAPVYKKLGISYVCGFAREIHPDDKYIVVEDHDGGTQQVTYDYVINATGPKLNFAATPGLGPDGGYSVSICTASHATFARDKYLECIKKMERGEKQKFVIGTGHGTCTCQGAAYEYIHNIAFDLERRGLREKADITWISNEAALGDFGVGGIMVKKGNHYVSGKIFAESTFIEKGISWVDKAHVKQVEEGKLHFIRSTGEEGDLDFDFAMLIPPFAGVPIKYVDKDGEDITSKMCAPNGMMKVDADYAAAQKPFEEWSARDWPKTYQSPLYPNVFAAGIAFAPPHPISKPFKAPDGSPVSATPPRTGMVAGIIGHAVALSIADMINGASAPTHSASMGSFGAACIASMGKSMLKGRAAAIVMFPVVPDFERFKDGRDMSMTFGDMGLAGHWIKHTLHHLFLWKMKGNIGWHMIPD